MDPRNRRLSSSGKVGNAAYGESSFPGVSSRLKGSVKSGAVVPIVQQLSILSVVAAEGPAGPNTVRRW